MDASFSSSSLNERTFDRLIRGGDVQSVKTRFSWNKMNAKKIFIDDGNGRGDRPRAEQNIGSNLRLGRCR